MRRLPMTKNSRVALCPQCGARPVWYKDCDTFGCPKCDIWTEPPHACTEKFGSCDAGFSDTPERPSLYTGEVEQI